MVKVGWLADDLGIIGGAEISDAIFIKQAPEDVEVARIVRDRESYLPARTERVLRESRKHP